MDGKGRVVRASGGFSEPQLVLLGSGGTLSDVTLDCNGRAKGGVLLRGASGVRLKNVTVLDSGGVRRGRKGAAGRRFGLKLDGAEVTAVGLTVSGISPAILVETGAGSSVLRLLGSKIFLGGGEHIRCAGWEDGEGRVAVSARNYDVSESVGGFFGGFRRSWRLKGPVREFVIFSANGGEGVMEDQRIEGHGRGTAPLAANAFTREGCEFLGWSENPDAGTPELADGAVVGPLRDDLYLYAVWSGAAGCAP